MTMEEFKQKAQEARKKKITHEQLQEWGKKSVQVRLLGMDEEEKKEYFSKISKGIKVKK